MSEQSMTIAPDLVTITATYDEKHSACLSIDLRLNVDRLTMSDIAALVRLLYDPAPVVPLSTPAPAANGHRSWAF